MFLLTKYTFHLQPNASTSASASSSVDPLHPGFDGSRAGVGIFPPKHDLEVMIRAK